MALVRPPSSPGISRNTWNCTSARPPFASLTCGGVDDGKEHPHRRLLL